MKRWTVMTILALAVTLSVVPAQAQRKAGPCREDVQKLCAGVQPGGGRLRDCLKQHAAELSPACQEHISKVKARVAAWRQACQGDVQNFCSGVAPGRGNLVKCLHQHENDLSQGCKDQLAQHRQRRRQPAAAQ